MEKRYNTRIMYLRKTQKGHLTSAKLNDAAMKALVNAEPGSKFLIRMLSDESKAKMAEANPDYQSTPDAVLEIMSADSVAEFESKNSKF